MIALAVIAAAVSVWLAMPGEMRRLNPEPKTMVRRAGNPRRLGLIVVVFLGVAGLFHAVTAVIAALAIVSWTVVWMVRFRKQERGLVSRCQEVARVGHLMESLLGLGHIPASALALTAQECPVVAPASSAYQLGADPCEVLDHLAATPGQEGLGEISRAWKVSTVSGGSMHSAFEQVRKNLEEEADALSVVVAELAPARSSGQILGILPVLGLVVAFAIGVDVLGFLTGSFLGRACLLLGVSLECVGLVWTETLAQGAFRTAGKAGLR